jgi:hypothetical protein
LFLKIDIDKAYDIIGWGFTLNMLDSLGFGSFYQSVVASLFARASAQVSVNGMLTNSIQLQGSIWQGFPLAPYHYVIAANVLGYLLEADRLQEHIRGISLHGCNQLLNFHFVDDLALTPKMTQQFVEGTLLWLDTLTEAVGAVLFYAWPSSLVALEVEAYKVGRGLLVLGNPFCAHISLVN